MFARCERWRLGKSNQLGLMELLRLKIDGWAIENWVGRYMRYESNGSRWKM